MPAFFLFCGFLHHIVIKEFPYHIAGSAQMADAEEAKAVLLAPANVDCGFSIVENNELKDRIISSIKDFSGIL